jgi:hypothetical protein
MDFSAAKQAEKAKAHTRTAMNAMTSVHLPVLGLAFVTEGELPRIVREDGAQILPDYVPPS